jgi:hypothetical protein
MEDYPVEDHSAPPPRRMRPGEFLRGLAGAILGAALGAFVGAGPCILFSWSRPRGGAGGGLGDLANLGMVYALGFLGLVVGAMLGFFLGARPPEDRDG